MILGSSYFGDVCLSVLFSDKFGFDELFEAIKRGCNAMTDSCSRLDRGPKPYLNCADS